MYSPIRLALVVSIFGFSNAVHAAKTWKCAPVTGKENFVGLDIYDDHPKKEILLKPDNGDDPYPHRWTLTGTDPWYACRYGKENKIQFMKRLGKVATCEMKESTDKSAIFDQIQCR